MQLLTKLPCILRKHTERLRDRKKIQFGIIINVILSLFFSSFTFTFQFNKFSFMALFAINSVKGLVSVRFFTRKDPVRLSVVCIM